MKIWINWIVTTWDTLLAMFLWAVACVALVAALAGLGYAAWQSITATSRAQFCYIDVETESNALVRRPQYILYGAVEWRPDPKLYIAASPEELVAFAQKINCRLGR